MTNEQFANEVATQPGKHNWYFINRKNKRVGVLPLIAVVIHKVKKDGKNLIGVTFEAPANFKQKDCDIYPTEKEWIENVKNITQ